MANDVTVRPTIYMGENSPEGVALKLLEMIAAIEQPDLVRTTISRNAADRTWLLDTYKECLLAAKGFRPPAP